MVFTTLKMPKVLIVSGIRVARPVNIGKLFFQDYITCTPSFAKT